MECSPQPLVRHPLLLEESNRAFKFLEDGVGGWNKAQLSENWESHYEQINCTALGFEYDAGPQTFFSLFGVLFANFLGVLTGVNMGGELQNPYKNIAKGELSAIAISTIGCFIFIITFGASVERSMLLCDTLVGERVSITKFLFLSGIYIASLSSLTAGLIGTPRVLQGIAAEGFIPTLNFLSTGVSHYSIPDVTPCPNVYRMAQTIIPSKLRWF